MTHVIHPLIMWLAGNGTEWEVSGTLVYDTTRPYSVRLAIVIDVEDEPLTFEFARDLMERGINGPVPETETDLVRFGPHERHPKVFVWISVTTGEDDAYPFVFYASRQPLVDFLSESYELLPVGREAEHLDVDGTIARILAEVA